MHSFLQTDHTPGVQNMFKVAGRHPKCNGNLIYNITSNIVKPSTFCCSIEFDCFQSLRLAVIVVISLACAQDPQTHLMYSDQLLAHYTMQWRDREVYWMCRQRSRTTRDVYCCILDSYDKAKIMLPAYPQKRTPKGQVYEEVRHWLWQLQYAMAMAATCFSVRRVCLQVQIGSWK